MKRKPVLVLPFDSLAEMERFWESLQIAGLDARWHGPEEAFDLYADDSPDDDEALYKCERKDSGEA